MALVFIAKLLFPFSVGLFHIKHRSRCRLLAHSRTAATSAFAPLWGEQRTSRVAHFALDQCARWRRHVWIFILIGRTSHLPLCRKPQKTQTKLLFVQTVEQVRFLALAILAAIFTSLALSDVFLLAQVPGTAVAATAIVSAGLLAIGVAVRAALDRLS